MTKPITFRTSVAHDTDEGLVIETRQDISERLIVKQKTIRVLLDTGSSGNLLFIKKGSQKYIPTMKRAIAQSWGTSNGTFQMKKVGMIDISFTEYSASKSVKLTPDIVEYEDKVGAQAPLYNLVHTPILSFLGIQAFLLD